MQRQTGEYAVTSTTGESVRAFVPRPLPPDPPLVLDAFHPLLDRANQALGRLDGLSTLLPDTELFLYLYVRKEAVLSSQIEGTQSSLSDLLLFENEAAPGVPLDDVREVSNYVAAMQHGLQRLREGFPLSLRLIREIHGILLRDGRGGDQTPGEFRRSQNWIAGTRPGNAAYVPPPPERLMECLDSFEKFLHDETQTLPLLVQLGLIHVQFETIHPFLDGNGRLGRLLITLLLCARGALREPLLYLSLYFKTHRNVYYDLLQRVRTEGVWEAWLEFFLEGTEATAKQAANTAVELIRLFEADRKRIQAIGRSALSALRVHEYMQKKPLINIGLAARALNLSVPTVSAALVRLEEMGIARETTGRERDRIFAYTQYLNIVSAGTEPIRQ
ncbi:MAG: Fic family protein [Acidobacteria bacterium]|nr:Fic family protein [Acidobacteriota bacterium]MBW4045603.1 Fic family protein [Acidobacteriota bacterium]